MALPAELQHHTTGIVALQHGLDDGIGSDTSARIGDLASIRCGESAGTITTEEGMEKRSP